MLTLLGTWDASGWIVTQGSSGTGDFGTMKIEFSSGEFTTEGGLQSANDAAYVLKDADGDIPVAATFVDLTISGTATPVSQTFPDVQWDDMVFEIDCVVKSAKISGKLAADGRRPTHVFGGAVGELEGGGLAAGSIITVSYKKSVAGFSQNVACDFEPNGGTATFGGGAVFLEDWQMTCNDGTGPVDADLRLVDKDTDGPRGAICVDTLPNKFDIGSSTPNPICDSNGDAINIIRGNVIVND